MMKRITLALSFIFSCASCANSGDWDGEYRCTENLGEIAPGQVALIEYELKVRGGVCELVANGFQTSESISCAVFVDGEKMTINYLSYTDGSTKNVYGVAVYKVSEPLFSIKNKSGGMVTHWQSLWPGEPISKVDNCFKKAGTS